ncbi:GAF domain-containing protein [Methylobacterium sp. E-066]|uniref:GAF domain-containing protein n=1 Tax=Methylobacterium sp. E-066 TaxID=2836584 RepID=UPI001FBA848B|nr:GAF domain-containing protein [Methylobacterium sp. E-066]MCJ2139974.1 GAF domain-containing protein [Methylobacterium sp. E-066]
MSVIPWSIILDPLRLEELSALNILDTKPEQSYDDLASIARLICGTPVANVTLVSEDRQWFKSAIGNDVLETPIEQSVCAHTIGEEEILIINDLTDDVRTVDNTLVTGSRSLRFYAGVPLRLEGSFGVGTLCVLDTKPHPEGLNPYQVEALKALGRQATILLQIRKFLATHEQAEHYEGVISEPIEEISDALLKAYKLNKVYKDSVLENLLFSSLTHIAIGIARSGKSVETILN